MGEKKQKRNHERSKRMDGGVLGAAVDVFDMKLSWESFGTTGKQPAARSGYGFVKTKDDCFIIFGGVSASGYLNDVHSFRIAPDPKSGEYLGSWDEVKTTGNVPDPRGYSGMALLENRWIYMFGGVSNNVQFHNDVHELDLRTLQWRRIEAFKGGGAPPPGRCGSSVCLSGKLLIIFGGCGAKYEHFNDVWAFDMSLLAWVCLFPASPPSSPQTLTSQADVATFPSPRRNAGLCYQGHDIYIFGGKGAQGAIFSDVFRFDVRSASWELLSSSLVKNEGFVGSLTLLCSNHIIIHGGLLSSSASSSLLVKSLGPIGFGDRKFLRFHCEGEGVNLPPAARGMHGGITLNLPIVDKGSHKKSAAKNGAGKGMSHKTNAVDFKEPVLVVFGGSDNKRDLDDMLLLRLNSVFFRAGSDENMGQ